MNNVRSSAAKKPAASQSLVLAVVIGLIAAGMSYFWLTKQAKNTQLAQANIMQVVVASKEISSRTTIKSEMLTVKSLPSTEVADGAFASAGEVLELVALQPILAGQTVTRSMVLAPLWNKPSGSTGGSVGGRSIVAAENISAGWNQTFSWLRCSI